MTEREELIKEWTNHDMRLPAIKLAEGGYLDRALAIAFESGHAAGRRSRQKQDAELLRNMSPMPGHHVYISNLNIAAKIEETP